MKYKLLEKRENNSFCDISNLGIFTKNEKKYQNKLSFDADGILQIDFNSIEEFFTFVADMEVPVTVRGYFLFLMTKETEAWYNEASVEMGIKEDAELNEQMQRCSLD